ncbi:MAG TPA: aldolase/citrate lyase family protein, partial [Gammaproteobacteria bacterium]
MASRDNPLLDKLRAGTPATGCWQFTPSPDVAEILSLCGFDALLVDHEHGPGALESLLGILRAAGRNGTSVLVRVPWNDAVYLKRVLDLGVDGVMVPMLEDAAQARAAVAACRYPPQGKRGAAWSVVRASRYGLEADYAAQAWERLLLIGQVESLAAVERLPEIAAVDGLDLLLIGPLDLSCSVGYPGELDHPEVRAAVARAEAAILAAGKWLGGVARSVDEALAMRDRGYHLVLPTSDLHLLRDGGR